MEIRLQLTGVLFLSNSPSCNLAAGITVFEERLGIKWRKAIGFGWEEGLGIDTTL